MAGFSIRTMGIDLSTSKHIKIRYKNSSAGNHGRVHFITNSNTTWNTTKSQMFTINANDSSYTEYTIDMSSISTWTGILKQLRIDPVDDGDYY